MTKAQATTLVSVLRAAYPQAKIGGATLKLYASRLEPMKYELARDAIGAVIDESVFWPSVAELKAAYGRRAEAARPRNAVELPPPPTPEEKARLGALMREQLASWKAMP